MVDRVESKDERKIDIQQLTTDRQANFKTIRMYYFISIVIVMVIISTIVEIDAKQLRGISQ